MVPLGHHRPLACGQESDLENEDDKILNTTGLPEEIAGDVEVFNIRNDEIQRITSDDEDSDLEPPLAKKQKQNAKKIQDKCEMAEVAFTNTNMLKF